ncbi:MAG: DUF6434 domain-containing protein [Planctomycetota bacterium]
MPKKAPTRPPITLVRSSEELRQWYFLKSDLVAHAKSLGLSTGGNKPELIERIGIYLDTGEVVSSTRKKPKSRFDWGKEKLTMETPITDNYRNTRNVRGFMLLNASARFKFSNEFMAWMRSNVGKTLADAITFWKELDRKKKAGYREKPLPQNQFNRFTREISSAVPGISAAKIRKVWAVKSAGAAPHSYKPGDEDLC